MTPPVRATFDRLLRHAKRRFPTFHATLSMGDARDFRPRRAHAWCESYDPPHIVCAPKLDYAHADRIEGVLRHEFGHALAFHAGYVDHTERDADDVAAHVFGDVIRYDDEDVQTIGAGVTPRPARLGV
jgi:hypothetical protein